MDRKKETFRKSGKGEWELIEARKEERPNDHTG